MGVEILARRVLSCTRLWTLLDHGVFSHIIYLLFSNKVAFPLGLEAAVIADLGAWEGVQHHPPQPQASECQKNDRLPALRAARDARDASRNRDLNRQPPFSVHHMV